MLCEGIKVCARHMDPAPRGILPGEDPASLPSPRSALHGAGERREWEARGTSAGACPNPAGNDPHVSFAP
eukprot:14777461-Heterocapsa_arctica.AAC.1